MRLFACLGSWPLLFYSPSLSHGKLASSVYLRSWLQPTSLRVKGGGQATHLVVL